MSSIKSFIERGLKIFTSNLSDPTLRPLLEYSSLTNGKRLRPIIVMMSAKSVGGTPEEVIELALSFELLHTATMVHDDILDHDLTRRAR